MDPVLAAVGHLNEKADLARKDSGPFAALLAGMWPHQALMVWHRLAAEPDGLTQAGRDYLHWLWARFPTRRTLLTAVYGNSKVTDELTYVRLPSRSKLAVARRVAAGTHYPWMTSRLLHVIAFRPRYFTGREAPAGQQPWGPLYAVTRTPKGDGRFRRIEKPNPVLKRVQRSLLRNVLDPAMAQLPDYVCGCRPGVAVVDNALRHCPPSEFRYIVTLDLKDFFGSFRARHVVGALKDLGDLGLDLEGEATESSASAKSPHSLKWDWQTALFVAKLTMTRGHLPQGAPTSPAIANLAFAPWDERISKAVGAEFTYTRYVDDLTFSLSHTQARALGLAEAEDASGRVRAIREFVVRNVAKVLEGSGFRINSRKTRAGTTLEGHKVTGFVVKTGAVDLPRSTKRRLRATIRRLANRPFVECARKWWKTGKPREIRYVPSSDGTPGRHFFQAQRLSVEQMGTLMLRKIDPEFAVVLPVKIDQPLPDGGAVDMIRYSGKERWSKLEPLLARLWRRELSAVPLGDKEVSLRAKGGAQVAKLTADTTGQRPEEEATAGIAPFRSTGLVFVTLKREDATACVELWHRLRGLVLYLRGAGSREPEKLERLAYWHDQLDAAFAAIDLRAPATRLARSNLADDVVALLDVLRKENRRPGGSRGQAVALDRFRSPVTDASDLVAWLNAACTLTVDTLPRLARAGSGDESPLQHAPIFTRLRVLRDRAAGRRGGCYAVECTLRQELVPAPERLPPPTELTDRQAGEIHVTLMLELLAVLHRARRRPGESPSAWKKKLVDNPWLESPDARVRRAQAELETLHRDLASGSPSESGILPREAASAFGNRCGFLPGVLDDPNSHAVWRNLNEMGRWLGICVVEPLLRRLTAEQDTGQTGPRRRLASLARPPVKAFDTLRLLRNRASHAEASERRADWVRLQCQVAEILGRDEPTYNGPPEGMRHPDDLRLTPLEGAEVQLHLLRECTRGLKAAAEHFKKLRAKNGEDDS